MIDKIDALLPQTQCGGCGFAACRPYASAIADGYAAINQCAPGGNETIIELSRLLNVEYKELDPAFGSHKPQQQAFIIEENCIGCMKCIIACPVDAIIGANKHIHTVIAQECTGCALCIAPCPVDCIVLQETALDSTAKNVQRTLSRSRYVAKEKRKEKEAQEKALRALNKKQALLAMKANHPQS